MTFKKEGKTVTGRLSSHPDGYGFVTSKDNLFEDDIFIPARKMGSATDGDQVLVRLSRLRYRRGKRSVSGDIIKVISRGRKVIVGKLFRHHKDAYVSALDDRYHHVVRVVGNKIQQVDNDKIVAVSIVSPPGLHQSPVGKLVEVLGNLGDPEIQYKIVCHNLGIPSGFSKDVLEEIGEADEPDIKSLEGRQDFRFLPTVTIDGETARDYDDAISIEKLEKGSFRLWVHIADVSHYVKVNSFLDQEAFQRGTSVYFPDRAIPMLPETLSNDLCSLKPKVDRLTITVVLEIDSQGVVQNKKFFRSVICSDERMTYTQVNKILTGRDKKTRGCQESLVRILVWMSELCEVLVAKRRKRGSIDLDLPEPKIEYDADGEISDIVRSERNQSHRIIEEFMILANETVADYIESNGVACIYRVHESPDALKVEEFEKVLSQFGYNLERNSRGEFSAHSFQKLAKNLSGKKEDRFLSYLMLRSFKKAQYSEINRGHFGLASTCYSHFTSPIRRYPDLAIHRILKWMFEKKIGRGDVGEGLGQLKEVAIHSSDREQKVVEAEREIIRWSMARFMKERLGEEYYGFITGIKRNGFFVELLDHFVEGYVPVDTILDDVYVFDKKSNCLIGKKKHKVYRIGDSLKLRVSKVSFERHLVEFSPVIENLSFPKKRKQ
jgi:ribonuclease R